MPDNLQRLTEEEPMKNDKAPSGALPTNGTVDLHFGPAAPAEPYFDRSWSLPDIERVK
jgi:hypothetical protein